MTRGLTTEIYSLPSVLKKVESLEQEMKEKLAEQKNTTENLNFIWRAIIVSVIVALILSVIPQNGVFSIFSQSPGKDSTENVESMGLQITDEPKNQSMANDTNTPSIKLTDKSEDE